MNDRPAILMTLRGEPPVETPREPSSFEYEWCPSPFAAAIVRAGGIPVFLSNECPADWVSEALARCDGLFLTGGEDVAPEHFGETDSVGNLMLNPKRDAVELAAIAAADRMAMPILGVCRGVQVLNIARGGTVYQDLNQQFDRAPRDHSRGGKGPRVQSHDVELTPGCRLQDVLGRARFAAATSHHQAIRDVGRDLVVVAHSPEDGVIEAVEGPGDRFVVGVQWHPEVTAHDETTLRLFSEFISACRSFAVTRCTGAA
ncbi:MAG: gamma-glutamyl-gamma-aminobutyrate hydrolase family protein [Candidatus Zixiibacteriota bacterium]